MWEISVCEAVDPTLKSKHRNMYNIYKPKPLWHNYMSDFIHTHTSEEVTLMK